MNKKYYYVHLFTVDSPVYNKSIQDLIYKSHNYEKHLFIYFHKKSYEIAPKSVNCIYTNETLSITFIEDCEKYADYIIIHNLSLNYKQIGMLKEDIVSKCIWCVWGPDLYRIREWKKHRFFLYQFFRFFYHLIKYHEIYTQRQVFKEIKSAENNLNKLRAICAGFEEDIEEIKRRFPAVPVFQTLYPGEFYLDDIEAWDKLITSEKTTKTKILLGHCGMPLLQHKKWIKKLSPFSEQIELYIPMGYGNLKYSQMIERFAKRKFKGEIHFFKEKMTPKDYYLQVLSKVDYAIFDFTIQCAYGNAMLLLYLNKAIFYPENSVMYSGLSKLGIKVFKLEDFDVRKKTCYLKMLDNNSNGVIVKNKMRFESYASQWTHFFDSLN